MEFIKDYEVVIGLEVHIELKTQTKMFCSCPASFGGEANSKVCPICMGLPGAMPAFNKKALEMGAKAGLATGCTIANRSKFDRKNYFYPDLPKAYQISQYDMPLCTNGRIIIETKNGQKPIRITRIHLEEDAGKLSHTDSATLIDFNRAGIPLIEIVSEADINSAEEATAYLKKLRVLMLYTGISDCKMNEGSLRCDVNLSVRKKGESALGVRTELKNLNSFRFIEKAIEYEYRRQVEALERGETIICETRRFDEKSETTISMRPKETQAQYRFFPEPDLPYIEISNEQIDLWRSSLPAFPDERCRIYKERYSLTDDECRILTDNPVLADYFEKAAELSKNPKGVASMIISVLMGIWEGDEDIGRIAPKNLAALADIADAGTINSATQKKLLSKMHEKDFDPVEEVEKEGLAQINDKETVRCFVISAIEKCPKALEDYKKGKTTASKSIIGKAMGESRGKANPALVADLVEEELGKLL